MILNQDYGIREWFIDFKLATSQNYWIFIQINLQVIQINQKNIHIVIVFKEFTRQDLVEWLIESFFNNKTF